MYIYVYVISHTICFYILYYISCIYWAFRNPLLVPESYFTLTHMMAHPWGLSSPRPGKTKLRTNNLKGAKENHS